MYVYEYVTHHMCVYNTAARMNVAVMVAFGALNSGILCTGTSMYVTQYMCEYL
jgi:hypothetical protein